MTLCGRSVRTLRSEAAVGCKVETDPAQAGMAGLAGRSLTMSTSERIVERTLTTGQRDRPVPQFSNVLTSADPVRHPRHRRSRAHHRGYVSSHQPPRSHDCRRHRAAASRMGDSYHRGRGRDAVSVAARASAELAAWGCRGVSRSFPGAQATRRGADRTPGSKSGRRNLKRFKQNRGAAWTT